jgi:sulfate adenylyltransferase subunit 1
MVTAASTANLAIILIDARKGVVAQTRRHSYIAHLMGIQHLVVAVNKMDLVTYDQQVFEQIRKDYLEFATVYGITDVRFVPICALNGDMVVDRGTNLTWYNGPTVLDVLERAPAAHSETHERLRFPVQYVMRPQRSEDPELHDFRGFMGRVESGEISVGDEVKVQPSGQTSRVKTLLIGNEPIARALPEQSITILLEDELDVSRGDMLVHAHDEVSITRQLAAEVCWLAETPLDKQRKYIVRQATREVKALVSDIEHRIDMGTLTTLPAETLATNDIARINLKLAQSLCVDSYRTNRATGAFIIIDEATNNTVAAGMIR